MCCGVVTVAGDKLFLFSHINVIKDYIIEFNY